MQRRGARPGLGLLALAMAGCAGAVPNAGIDDISNRTSDAAGGPVAWHQTPDARAQAAARARDMAEAPLTAESAVRIAVLNNPGLQVELASLGIANAALAHAGTIRNPILDGSITAPTGGGPVNLDFGLAFELLDLLTIPTRRAIAGADLAATKDRLTGAVLTLAADTRAAFVDVQAAQARHRLSENALGVARSRHLLAATLLDAGNIPESRARHASLALEQATQRHRRMEVDVEKARAGLTAIMGFEPGSVDWTLSAALSPPPVDPPALHDLGQRAKATSVALSAAGHDTTATLKRSGLSRRSDTLEGGEAGIAVARDDGEWELGPSLAIPLPIFDSGHAEHIEADARLSRMGNLTSQLRIETVRDAENLARDVLASHQTAREMLESTVPMMEANHADLVRQYNAMQVDLFALFDSRARLLDGRMAALEEIARYWRGAIAAELVLRGGPAMGGSPAMAGRAGVGPVTSEGEH